MSGIGFLFYKCLVTFIALLAELLLDSTMKLIPWSNLLFRVRTVCSAVLTANVELNEGMRIETFCGID